VAEPSPASLHAALADLAKWLGAARIPAMIIGGVAASALGRPRLTQDIDALVIVPDSDWPNVVDSAARYGIVARIEGALEFARRSRVLLLRHTNSGIDIDVTFEAHAALAEFLLALEIASFDSDAAASYGQLRASLEKCGTPIGPLDTLIGAHAAALDVTLVTHNTREFSRIDTLRREDWTNS
jgi:predicted nucleic acid-binding protein